MSIAKAGGEAASSKMKVKRFFIIRFEDFLLLMIFRYTVVERWLILLGFAGSTALWGRGGGVLKSRRKVIAVQTRCSRRWAVLPAFLLFWLK